MATDTKTFWEDIEIGRVLETGSLTLNAPEIRNFAQKYDPQPYHLDRDAAEASLFGGLCASGWHMTALMMKLISDQLDAEKIPLLGTGEVSWLEWYRPAFEGDSLSARMTVTEKSLPAAETDHGLVGCDIDVHNQDQKKVMALSTFLMIENTGGNDG
jgi:acyl dehydratase